MAKAEAEKLGPELVIGLVGALGANLDEVTAKLQDALSDVGYKHYLIRASRLLHQFDPWQSLPSTPLDEQIHKHQEAGNELRCQTNSGDAMAVLTIGEIQRTRKEMADGKLHSGAAYIIRSLKHPDEVQLLRRVYGSAFFLVAAYSPLKEREEHLAGDVATSHGSSQTQDFIPRVRSLIQRDEAEEMQLGQRVRDTFPLADIFVTAHRPPDLRKQIERFVEILFGNTFRTPSRSESAMFQAFSAALRSADPSRQVGAVITTVDADIVAMGTNEVPRAGGGAYWEGDPGDARDFQGARSSFRDRRRVALSEVLHKLQHSCGWVPPVDGEDQDTLLNKALEAMDGTLLMSSGEFVRAVHAEMAALLDAARRGVSVAGCTLYSTTFPCHNCAKHIVAAGIARVEYIEPFPKSLASELHGDALVVDSDPTDEQHVAFQPFVGIAPRRYADLFQKLDRRDASGGVLRWTRANATPRYPGSWHGLYYPNAEDQALLELKEKLEISGIMDKSSDSV